MSELGYYAQIEGGVYGTPDPGDPVSRAALQAAAQSASEAVTTAPGYIPPDYRHQGGGNLPIIGWTCQNSTGSPFREPYQPTGHTPDWNADANPIGAGSFDQNEAFGSFAFDRENRAPIGGAVLEYSQEDDPNFFPEDQGGTIDLEW